MVLGTVEMDRRRDKNVRSPAAPSPAVLMEMFELNERLRNESSDVLELFCNILYVRMNKCSRLKEILLNFRVGMQREIERAGEREKDHEDAK